MISCTIISHLNDYPCNLIDGSSPRAPFASSKWWQAGVPMPLLRAMIMMTSALRANLAHCLPRSLLSLSPAHGKQHFRRPFSHTRHRAERDFPVHKYSSPARVAKRYKAPVNKIHSIEAQTLKSTKGRNAQRLHSSKFILTNSNEALQDIEECADAGERKRPDS